MFNHCIEMAWIKRAISVLDIAGKANVRTDEILALRGIAEIRSEKGVVSNAFIFSTYSWIIQDIEKLYSGLKENV